MEQKHICIHFHNKNRVSGYTSGTQFSKFVRMWERRKNDSSADGIGVIGLKNHPSDSKEFEQDFYIDLDSINMIQELP